MQRRQENRDERDECPFRDDFVSDTADILPIHRERRGPGKGQLPPSDEQKPCWLLLVRFP
jgi:hypothetical protein